MVQDQSIDPAGNVYFPWAGYQQNGGAKGAVNFFISKSADGSSAWTNQVSDVSSESIPNRDHDFTSPTLDRKSRPPFGHILPIVPADYPRDSFPAPPTSLWAQMLAHKSDARARVRNPAR